MTKGTPSFGKRHKRNHLMCPRCGNMAYHKQKQSCASCAFPEAKRRTHASLKARRRAGAHGFGPMKHIKRELRKSRTGHKCHPLIASLHSLRN